MKESFAPNIFDSAFPAAFSTPLCFIEVKADTWSPAPPWIEEPVLQYVLIA